MSAGGVLCSTAFLGGLANANFAAIWTQFLSLFFSVIASLLFGGDPSRFLQSSIL